VLCESSGVALLVCTREICIAEADSPMRRRRRPRCWGRAAVGRPRRPEVRVAGRRAGGLDEGVSELRTRAEERGCDAMAGLGRGCTLSTVMAVLPGAGGAEEAASYRNRHVASA
jgi:hypothetical protein